MLTYEGSNYSREDIERGVGAVTREIRRHLASGTVLSEGLSDYRHTLAVLATHYHTDMTVIEEVFRDQLEATVIQELKRNKRIRPGWIAWLRPRPSVCPLRFLVSEYGPDPAF